MLQLIPFVKGFQNKRRTRVGLNGQSKAEFEKKEEKNVFNSTFVSRGDAMFCNDKRSNSKLIKNSKKKNLFVRSNG